MFKKIKKEGYEIVLSNFLNLSIVYGLGLLLPLLTIPYTIRVLGIENVGLIAFSTSIVSYFGILINYGFNLSATTELAQNINNITLVNQIFCNVTYSKFFLSIISLLIFLILLFFFSEIQKYSVLYIFLFLSVILTSLSPDWFFQGVQKMKFISRLNVVTKILSTILVFFLVKKPADYFFLGVIPFVNSLILFVVSQYYIIRVYKIRFLKYRFDNIFIELNKGKYVFLSQVKITFFSNFNVLVLGLLTNNAAVGIFSSADKIIKVFLSIQTPICAALFPHFASKIKESKVSSWYEIIKIAKLGAIIYFFVMLLVFLLADFISKIMFGTHVESIALLIRIMSLIPIFVFINNLFGTQYLLNTKNDKSFLMVLIIAAVSNVILLFPLVYFLGALGTSITIVITEFIVLVGMYLEAKKVFNKSIKTI